MQVNSSVLYLQNTLGGNHENPYPNPCVIILYGG